MERNRQEEAERVVYRIGLAVGAVFLCVIVAASILKIDVGRILGDTLGVCPFYRVTHLYCPACGGIRSLISFLHGNWLLSATYNGFVFYMMLGYVLFMVSHTLDYITKGRIHGIKFHMFYLYLGVVIAILQWIIKNADALIK